MNKTLKHTLVLLPALFIVGLFLFIRIVQFEPLNPKNTAVDNNNNALQIPIFQNDPLVGNPKAPITLIAFEDLGCEACKIQNDIFTELINTYPERVKVVFKLLTVTRFPQSTKLAHSYAFCANEQNKFTQFKDMAFVNYQNLSESTLKVIAEEIKLNERQLQICLESNRPESYLTQNEAVASAIGLQAVPTIFYQNRQLTAPDSVAGWKQLLDL